jgi:hypothetical protein
MSELSISNLRAIAWHLEQEEDNGGIGQFDLALQLRSVADELAASQARVKELEEALLWIADLAGGSLDGDAKRDAVIEKVARAALAAPAEKGKQL